MAKDRHGITGRIAVLEAIRAFLEQWGLWKYAAWCVSLLNGAIVWAWTGLKSNLDGWAIFLVGLGAIAITLIIWNQALLWLIRRKRYKVTASETEEIRKRRRIAIDDCREMIAAHMAKPSESREDFKHYAARHTCIMQIKPFLSEGTREGFRPTHFIVGDDVYDGLAIAILKDLEKLEREWGL